MYSLNAQQFIKPIV